MWSSGSRKEGTRQIAKPGTPGKSTFGFLRDLLGGAMWNIQFWRKRWTALYLLDFCSRTTSSNVKIRLSQCTERDPAQMNREFLTKLIYPKEKIKDDSRDK